MLLLTAIFLQLASNQVNTLPSVPSKLTSYIVGGKPIEIGEAPYQAAVLLDPANVGQFSFACGAAIIKDDVLLTSGRCTSSFQANQFKIRAGSTYRSTGGQLLGVREIQESPVYGFVALLFTTQPFVLGPRVKIIPLPAIGNHYPGGTSAMISGWGRKNLSSDYSEDLQSLAVTVVEFDRCKEAWAPFGGIGAHALCAWVSEQGDGGFCQGDEGSPLVIDGVVAGVAAFTYRCSWPGMPDVYDNVSMFRDWIDEAMGMGR